MLSYQYVNIFTRDNKIPTPEPIKDVSGHRPDTYCVDGNVYLHFPDIRTTGESERMFRNVARKLGDASVVRVATVFDRAGTWDDICVICMPERTFRKRLSSVHSSLEQLVAQ